MKKGTFRHTEEAKKRIGDAMRGRLVSDETRKRIALSKIGNTNGFKKGEKKLPFTEEHKRKLSINWFKKGQIPHNKGVESPIRGVLHPYEISNGRTLCDSCHKWKTGMDISIYTRKIPALA